MVAAWSGHEAVVRLLLGHKDVRPDIHAPCGWTALTFAAHNGHEAVVRLLLERDDVDADKALSFAAYGGHETILQVLRKQDGVSEKSRDRALKLAMTARHEAPIRRALGCDDSLADGRAPQHTPCMVRCLPFPVVHHS